RRNAQRTVRPAQGREGICPRTRCPSRSRQWGLCIIRHFFEGRGRGGFYSARRGRL
ncbi:uncharacterized protein METZ01_LOCUS486748, partial [marine metagenome]